MADKYPGIREFFEGLYKKVSNDTTTTKKEHPMPKPMTAGEHRKLYKDSPTHMGSYDPEEETEIE